jgi:ATP-dependent exoDNAse (exonuclease V) alpha subunit
LDSAREHHRLSQREEIKALLDATGGVFVQGGPGVGKSTFAEWLPSQYPGKVVMMAPTNRAAANLKGWTIHSFVGGDSSTLEMGRPGLLRDLAAADVVVIDEASMLTEYLMRCLLTLKRAKPSLKVVVMGDWDQLRGVEQLAVPCDYSEHPSLKEICAYNLVVLTKQYRTDDPKQIEVLDRFRRGDKVDMTAYYSSEGSCKRAVAWTNYGVELVNAQQMAAHKPADALHVPEDVASGAPEAWLYVGLPVAGAKTIKLRREDDVPPAETEVDAQRRSKRLYNQQTGIVTAVDPEARTFTVEYDYEKDYHYGREFTWSVDEFSTCFSVAYCVTVHKAQGQTWAEDFAIYEWERMDRHLLYTAVSRATHSRHVHLGTLPEADHEAQRRAWRLDNAIRSRLASYRASDTKEGRPVCDLTPTDVRAMLDASGNNCPTCGCRLALFKSTKDASSDRNLWVLDRRNWKTGGHTRGNVCIKCLGCNDTHEHEEAE